MNRLISASVFILVGVLTWGIEIKDVSGSVVGTFPIGKGNGALTYIDSDPYEPEAPSCLQVDESGDYYILDFHQGIVHYSSKVGFLEVLPAVGYNRLSVSKSLVVTWSDSADNDSIITWQKKSGLFGAPIVSKIIASSGRQLVIRGKFIFCRSYKMKVQGFSVAEGKIAVLKDNDVARLAEKSGLLLKDDSIWDSRLGILTDSAEEFFVSRKIEGPIKAEDGTNKDKVNLAVGSIFAIDEKGNRYLFYNRNGLVRIAVVSAKGDLKIAFRLNSDVAHTTKYSLPCLSPDGNIYYIRSTKAGHEVIRLSRSW